MDDRRADVSVPELDLRGVVSPFVMSDTYHALQSVPPGGTLAVLTDHPPALATLPDLARDFDGTATTDQLADHLWRVMIRKGSS